MLPLIQSSTVLYVCSRDITARACRLKLRREGSGIGNRVNFLTWCVATVITRLQVVKGSMSSLTAHMKLGPFFFFYNNNATSFQTPSSLCIYILISPTTAAHSCVDTCPCTPSLFSIFKQQTCKQFVCYCWIVSNLTKI